MTPEILCAKGFKIIADHTTDEIYDLDLLLLPGDRGTRPLVEGTPFLKWVKEQPKKSKWVGSICTGGLILNNAGLINSREVTTHLAFANNLQKLNPNIKVSKEKCHTLDEPITTAAGIIAGIDLALHFVEIFYGRERANHTSKYMQYSPIAPFEFDLEAEVMFPKKSY